MANALRSCVAVSMFFILVVGCGSIAKDSPGVTVSATITPTYNGANTSSVDAFQDVCTNGTVTQAEFFTDHMATASISASLINPSNLIKQMTVYIDSYTINYQNSLDSPGAPPIQPDTRQNTISFIVSSGTATALASFSVEFVDLIRKYQYLNDMLTGGFTSAPAYINNYTAIYTFAGHSENGVPFTFSAQTDFQIGDFNNCPAGYLQTGLEPM